MSSRLRCIVAGAACLATVGCMVAAAPAPAIPARAGAGGSAASTACACADLVGTFVAGDHTLAVGQKATYAFRVHNRGPDGAVNVDVQILLPLPRYVKFVSSDNGDCYQFKYAGKDDVDCFLTHAGHHISLAPGDSKTLHFVLKALRTGDHRISAYAGDSHPADPNLDNNRDKYHIVVG